MDRRERNFVGPVTADAVRAVVNALDARGAWVERGSIRITTGKERELQPVIESRTFIRNLQLLASYAAAK